MNLVQSIHRIEDPSKIYLETGSVDAVSDCQVSAAAQTLPQFLGEFVVARRSLSNRDHDLEKSTNSQHFPLFLFVLINAEQICHQRITSECEFPDGSFPDLFNRLIGVFKVLISILEYDIVGVDQVPQRLQVRPIITKTGFLAGRFYEYGHRVPG